MSETRRDTWACDGDTGERILKNRRKIVSSITAAHGAVHATVRNAAHTVGPCAAQPRFSDDANLEETTCS